MWLRNINHTKQLQHTQAFVQLHYITKRRNIFFAFLLSKYPDDFFINEVYYFCLKQTNAVFQPYNK